MRYDLLAIDLDGTLLDSQHALPPDNRAALHRAHEAGLKIVLCTGRSFTETRPILAQIGLDLDATVAVFGALVSDARTGCTLHSTPIAMDIARQAVSWLGCGGAGGLGYPVLWLTDANACGHDGYIVAGPRRHPAVDRWAAESACRVSDVDALPADGPPPLRLSIIDDSDALETVSARLRSAFDGHLTHNILHAPPYRLSLIEAFAPAVNKWYGIEYLCRRWGIAAERTAAVGDDVNDIAMLRGAGLGIAMGNARPAVQAAADRVIETNDACGVARLIEELLAT